MTNTIFALIAVSFFFATGISAQNDLKPTDKEALAIYKILNPDQSPYANETITFVGKKGTKIKAKTDNNGQVKALLPLADEYHTVCGEYINSRIIDLKSSTQQRSNAKIIQGQRVTFRFIDYTFEYKNEEGEPVPQEVVTIKGKDGKVYQETTGSDGRARFYIPIGQPYSISVKHHPNLKELNLPDKGQSSLKTGYTFYWMGSVAKIQYDLEEAEEERRWAEEERIQDSIRSVTPTTIIFFASNPNYKSVGTITIYDGGKDGAVCGEVKAVWNCHSGPRTEDKIEAKTVKMKGTYRYYAKSSQGIEWEGTYEVLGGGTLSIPLDIK